MIPLAASLLTVLPTLLLQQRSTPPDRWVVHLVDGRVHRGPARETPDGFEIRRGQDWQLVPLREVAKATPERDVLADLAARRRSVGEDLDLRVEAARFALAAGLLEESIADLDAALAADPDHAGARALLASAPLALTLPATAERSLAERLVLFGARAKPAYRELAASRLGELPREEALRELARGLPSPAASVRAFAAFALRRLEPRAQADALVRRAVVDPSDRVRLEAARALRDANDEVFARRVAAALCLDDGRLRTFAAQSLGEMGYRGAVPALVARLSAAQSGSHPGGYRAHIKVGNQVAYVQDFNVEIAQGASIGDPIVGVVEDATVLDVRVGGTSSQRVWFEVPTLCRSLARLTGEKIPEAAAPWLSWWEQNAARYSEGSPPPSATSTGERDP